VIPDDLKKVSLLFLGDQSPRRTLENRGDACLRNFGNNVSSDELHIPEDGDPT
jgi:hypothetical protein